MDKLTHELHQKLQGDAHLLILGIIAMEGVCSVLGWFLTETKQKKLTRTAIIARSAGLLVAATWHYIGWIEHRDAARQDPETSEP